MEKLLQQWHEVCQDFYQVLALKLPFDGLLCFVTDRNTQTNRYAQVYVNNGSVQEYTAFAYQYDPVHYSHLPQTEASISFLNQYSMNETYLSFLNFFHFKDSAEIITPYQNFQFGISLVRDKLQPLFQSSDYAYLEAVQKLSLHVISKMELPDEQAPAAPTLTKKEMMILKMLCMGLSNQEIADQAFCSITTVKTHVSHILYKTECKNRQQLISKYYPVAMKSLH